jgi:polar amino acid transport system permease protein
MFNFGAVLAYLPDLLQGAVMTLALTGFSLVLGIVLGTLLALARLSHSRVLRWPAYAFIEFFRTTPPMIQIIWCYFALPVVIGHEVNSFQAAVIALCLNASAFLAEMFRTGILGVDLGQKDASRMLGLSPFHTFVYVVAPQAIRLIFPSTAATAVLIMKGTSLASAIGLLELTRIGQLVSTETFRPLETFSIVAALYFCIGFPVLRVARVIDRKIRLT